MRKILEEIENFLNDFNQDHGIDFAIDTIRIQFNKEHKLKHLQKLGAWNKITLSSNISSKLKKRLKEDEITSAYQLNKENVYYFNSNIDRPRYNIAVMVIFGMKQYTSTPPNNATIKSIVSTLRDVSSIDVCYDTPTPPTLEELSKRFNLTHFKDSVYINTPNISMIEKIIVYNKAIKNGLIAPLWRIEFTISIPNVKVLAIPLHDMKEIINTIRGNQ
ncbi:MAG: hypothetical protein NTY39_00210 [Campylobacterales bacterium]|nr:hypothetical protein [Campylobacterales bacterium]